jgi:hypothetical protein
MEAGTTAGVPTVHTFADLRTIATLPVPQRGRYYVRMANAFVAWDPASSQAEASSADNPGQSIVPSDRIGKGGRWIVTHSVGDPWSPLVYGSELYAWYRADLEIVGAVVANWGNAASPARDAAQGTGANQALLVHPDSRFNNLAAVEFDGTNDHVKASTAADWKCLHDGTGFAIFVEFHVLSGTTGSRALIDTFNGTGANVGIGIAVDATNQKLSIQVANGGANIINYAGVNGECLNGVKHMLTMTYSEGRTPTEFEIRLDGVTVASGNSSAAPSASDPFGALAIGALTGAAGGFMRGPIAEVAIVRRAGGLPTSELQNFEFYAARYTA